MDSGERVANLLVELLTQHAPPGPRAALPLVGIDECANHPAIRKAIRRALKSDLILLSRQLWSQLRQKSDGTHLWLEGRPPPRDMSGGVEYGLPVKGHSFADVRVAENIAIQFMMADRVIVLTENARGDPEGLKRILLKRFKPVLKQYHQNRFGLLVLMKKGKTGWGAYSNAFLERLDSGSVDPGFEYRRV